MSTSRVVITGMGVVCPVGLNKTDMWEALKAGKSGAGPVTRFDVAGWDVRIGAEVKGFNPDNWIDPREARRLDRFSQFGIACAEQAVTDAALDPAKCDRSRCGVIVGSGIGGLGEFEEQHKKFMEKGPGRVSPFFIPKLMMNAVSGHVSIKYGFKGPNFAVASACASANHAMGVSFGIIRRGEADVMITGGSEAALTPIGLAGFSALGALSKRNDAPEKASRPFDKNRDGFVLGEGAGLVVLESLEHARKRGAPIVAEFLGFGMNGDGHHITAPDPEGTGGAEAMRMALADCGLRPEHVQYINAHGTSTELNDKVESKAINKLFGPYARKLAVSSTKSMIGHMLGAAGAAELIATIMCIQNGIVHPTINYETPDPECDLDYVPNEMRRLDIDVALSNSLGFGGHNATIAVGKFRENR
jgi:3-oxoacyl-[acyl-carrier-protein] synthase II